MSVNSQVMIASLSTRAKSKQIICSVGSTILAEGYSTSVPVGRNCVFEVVQYKPAYRTQAVCGVPVKVMQAAAVTRPKKFVQCF
ncbi:hypothetical protein NG798_07725 [Ancylothrix sp. C2]|uniref:hypothetical protein n=1 Tax=Ancylothrix sp. D3o TaxID=2953691 RepID=UPI0021BA5439|nr:hypothetical protein [Ancylothrix sp. D3o]MCT7949672.1 hypothetical protein [Ancylothrix sp. D3o]